MDPRFPPRRGMLLNSLIPTDTPPKRVARLVSFGVLLALVAIFGLLSLRVMSSFLLPLLLAAMLVVIFGPLHRWLRDRIIGPDKGPEWIPALLTTLFVLLIVLVPLFLLVARAGGDAVRIFRAENGLKLDPAVLSGLVERINDTTGMHLTADSVNGELRRIAEEWIGPVAARTPVVIVKGIIGLVVMTVSLFYFLADGRRMLATVTRLIPLDHRYQWQLLQEFEEVSRAVVSSISRSSRMCAGSSETR